MLARSIVGVSLLLALSARAQEPAPDPLDIVRRSVDRDWTDFESRKNYTYQERSEFREYGRSGGAAKVRSETNEILILGGRPYERLIARNGKPLPAREERLFAKSPTLSLIVWSRLTPSATSPHG